MSDVSKSDLYSNAQTLDTGFGDINDFNWMKSMNKDEPVLSRHDRKTDSNILSKKNAPKITEE